MKNSKLFIRCVLALFSLFIMFSYLQAQNPNSLEFVSFNSVINDDDSEIRQYFHPQISILYISNGIFSDSKSQPRKLEIDVASLDKLYEQNPLFEDIEFIKLLISNANENNFSIRLSQLEHFSNLKYFLISYTYDICGNFRLNCLENNLRSKIVGSLPITILYQLSVPQ